MVDISDSSFSSILEVEEDNEYDSFLYDVFIDEKIFNIDFDDHTEIINEISEVAAGEINSKISNIWKFFTRKEKINKDQNGDEQIETYILCNIGQCCLSAKNSTTTLERHLKAKHHDTYIEFYEQKNNNIEPWI